MVASMVLGLSSFLEMIPMVSHRSTSSALDDSMFPFFVRTIPGDIDNTYVMADLLKSWGYDRVGLVRPGDTHGAAYEEMFIAACAELGINVRVFSFCQPCTNVEKRKESFDALFATMKESDYHVFVNVLYDSTSGYGTQAPHPHERMRPTDLKPFLGRFQTTSPIS